MQKQKMVTTLLVASILISGSLSNYLGVANAGGKTVAQESLIVHNVSFSLPVTQSQDVKTNVEVELKSKTNSPKKPSVKKTSTQKTTLSESGKKKVVTAATTKKKKPAPKKKKRTPSRGSRGGSSTKASQVVDFAKDQLGKPYVWGAAGPNSFDCSGFTLYVYSKFGKSLPHNSAAQSNSGTTVSKGDIIPGDLLFFKTGGSSVINHVGIYIGNDQFIHGSSGRGSVYISDLSEYTKYAGVFVTAKRIL